MTKLARFAALACLVFLFACKKTPDKVVSINPDEFTIEDEIKIGAAFRDAIASDPQTFPLLDSAAYPQAFQYVETLLKTAVNTAQVERRPDFEWTLDIIQNDSMTTAFFLPGGHFYAYTGLLKYLESESQLLAVIGHELYYADSSLLVLKMKKEFGGSKLGDILLGNPVDDLRQMSARMPQLVFDGSVVLRADAYAIGLLCPFLYNPLGLEGIFEKAGTERMIWLERRVFETLDRLQNIENEAFECGLPGVDNAEAYARFKSEYLP